MSEDEMSEVKPMARNDSGWHLDKRVPVSIILVLLVQLVGGTWVASQMNSDIRRNADDIARLQRQAEVSAQAAQAQAIQLGRIEESISGLRVDINRMLRAIERGAQ